MAEHSHWALTQGNCDDAMQCDTLAARGQTGILMIRDAWSQPLVASSPAFKGDSRDQPFSAFQCMAHEATWSAGPAPGLTH